MVAGLDAARSIKSRLTLLDLTKFWFSSCNVQLFSAAVGQVGRHDLWRDGPGLAGMWRRSPADAMKKTLAIVVADPR
jgi:hypothetical protein